MTASSLHRWLGRFVTLSLGLMPRSLAPFTLPFTHHLHWHRYCQLSRRARRATPGRRWALLFGLYSLSLRFFYFYYDGRCYMSCFHSLIRLAFAVICHNFTAWFISVKALLNISFHFYISLCYCCSFIYFHFLQYASPIWLCLRLCFLEYGFSLYYCLLISLLSYLFRARSLRFI